MPIQRHNTLPIMYYTNIFTIVLVLVLCIINIYSNE